MLREIEDSVIKRLESLKGIAPSIAVRAYHGELSAGGDLGGALASGHAALVAIPRVRFQRFAHSRIDVIATVRVILGARLSVTDASVRPAGALPGTHELWAACITSLAGFVPKTPTYKEIEPLKYTELINRQDDNEHISVVAQTFLATCHWIPQRFKHGPTTGMDLRYTYAYGDGHDIAHDTL